LWGIGLLTVGSNITLDSNLVAIRARCPSVLNSNIVMQTPCSLWRITGSRSVSVTAPLSPIAPTVVIIAPTLVSVCDNPVLDVISSSRGSSGRDWKTKSIVVQSVEDVGSAEQLNTFFHSSYAYNPPSAIGSGILKAGVSYEISVTLCSFLDQCGHSTHRMTVLSDPLPSVTLLGPSKISRSEELSLQSRAFVQQCDGSRSSEGLRYEWKVSENDVWRPLIQSRSRDPSKFKLESFTLNSSSTYVVELSVTHVRFLTNSRTSFSFQVSPALLYAVVTGGSVKTGLNQGKSLILSGGSSYYDDRGNVDRLSFEWSCVQESPVLSSTCGILVSSPSPTSPWLLKVLTLSSSLVGSVSAITLKVSDSYQEAEATIRITVLEADAPSISLNSSLGMSPANQLNPRDVLTVQGLVELSVPSTVAWSSQDVDLVTLFGSSSLSLQLGVGSHIVRLVFPSGSLLGSSAPYSFSLSSGPSSSSIVVKVNSPPSLGEFTVFPRNGTEMETIFSLSASRWSDSDLPLSYQIYRDPSNAIPVLF
jgi:hypothetical protein